ncbi:M16 family metallopeptidase [[Pseudopropionibacterium] massiliense]|uniref:M16 family metallopeptidase n=1 Tax=[Pseudopropionibacterium] massiliense TaxID=2220000 RepID=UPI002482E41F|nr:pitrilysin family protein [[Pseudopropionibacterium] massiliense]
MADTRFPVSSGFTVVRYRLGNGLELALLPDPHAPAVAVNLSFQVGSVDETPGRTGFAHLFEHLMFQGSSRVAPGEHMSVIEASGGNVNAFTSTDRTVYHECVPVGALELVLWLEADRLRSLAVTQENLDAQRDVVAQEKRQRYDNRPYGDLLAGLVGQHFGSGHPYGHLPIGSMADLAAASLAEVTAFHSRWYRPSHAKLVVCGALDPDETINLVERYFGDLEDLSPPPRKAITESTLPGGNITVTGEVPHPLVYCSWQAPAAGTPGLMALELGLSVLSDGHASRLHRRLVRERGIAHEVHGTLLGHLRSPSIASLSARPADGVDTRELAEAILEELADMEAPSEQELERAKAQYERGWLLELAAVEDRAEATADTWTTMGDPALINNRLADLAAVTSDDVFRVLTNRPSSSQLHYLPKGAS